MERCESGLIGSPGKTVCQKWHRGFESLSLRFHHDVALAKSGFAKSTSWFQRDTVRQCKWRCYNIFMYYVYSLKCKDGFYVGCTDNLKDRLGRHQKGNVPATA